MGKVCIEYDTLEEAYDIRCALEGQRYRAALDEFEEWLKREEEYHGERSRVSLLRVRYTWDECVGLLLASEDFRGLLDPPPKRERSWIPQWWPWWNDAAC